MQSVMRTLLCAAAAVTISLLTACGSGSGTTAPATIRVVNDTTSDITVSLNGLATLTAASQVTSGYTSVTPSTYTLSVATPTGLTGASSTVGLGTAQNYTALAYERGNNIFSAVYADNQAVPSAGFSSLDVANVSIDAGPLDVYLVPHVASGTPSLTGYQPTFSSVQGLSTATTLASTAPASGSTPAIAWDIVVTRAAAPDDVRLTLSNPNFASTQPYTLALTATAGGGLVNAVLIPQSLTTAVFTPTTQARVRVWSVLPVASTPAVLVSVGATAQSATTLSVANAPNPTAYQLVSAQSKVTAITLNGTPIATALPTGAFAAGGDYTVLIYGTAGPTGTPAALILTDTNQVVANYASVRLVNAAVPPSVSSPTSGLTIYVGNVEGASNVVYPTPTTDSSLAYIYTGVKPASSATINLIGPGYTQQTTGQFTSGSVYTVMVYDPTLPPLIVQDR